MRIGAPHHRLFGERKERPDGRLRDTRKERPIPVDHKAPVARPVQDASTQKGKVGLVAPCGRDFRGRTLPEVRGCPTQAVLSPGAAYYRTPFIIRVRSCVHLSPNTTISLPRSVFSSRDAAISDASPSTFVSADAIGPSIT